ncbi:DUF2339 domain-containing protein [Desulfosediminicola ganghwensis]|uniref:DUF2339 domain-containing protein n=1 Tax=Desulfosediminicola ganghwensis TaxID=2569540 RepID=UPI0010AB655E|nr:DUF2339 domain-containing protein [Desulfosediminicola ganghwensis]
MHLVLIVVSAIVTAVFLGWGGLVVGGLLGYCLAEVVGLKKRLLELEERLSDSTQAVRAETTPVATESRSVAAKIPTKDRNSVEKVASQPDFPEEEVVFAVASGDERAGMSASHEDNSDEQPVTSSLPDKLTAAIKRFFTEGNPVVKIGLVVLFFGVAFLLKYAADRSLLSIGARLILTASGGVSLVLLGWRLRNRPLGYGLGLQGGGIGILYITAFAAAKLYALIPLSAALFILVGMVIFSGVLALAQSARVLAAMGVIGGFLAPVLMSTGAGDHVLLFSYYAVLNIGIFAIALFKTWRELNLIGFFFTFGIGSYWILDRYSAAHFNTTEPFLILFFVLYVAIAVLFALRQPVRLKGVIDGPIVFGTPIVASMQQYQLVSESEYGMAVSFLAAGVMYLLLALFLRRSDRREGAGSRVLSEAFLALGVVGVSMSIPLAFDSKVTVAAWALEGAALVWVGVRQSRLLARIFGLLLQFGAGFIFLASVFYPFGSTPYINHYFLGCAWIGTGALFSSYWLYRRKDISLSWEQYLCWPLLIWGTVWWYYGGFRESTRHFEYLRDHNALLLFASALTMLLSIAARKCNWKQLAVAQCQFLPVLLFCGVVGLLADDGLEHLFAGWGAMVWAVAIFTQHRMLQQFDLLWPKRLAGSWHGAGFLLMLLLLCYELSWYVANTGFSEVWQVVVWGVFPALVLQLLIRFGARLAWPVQRWSEYYLGIVPTVIATALIGWLMWSMTSSGEAMVWGWLPLLNVLELSQICVFLSLLGWFIACKREHCHLPLPMRPAAIGWIFSFCVFLWANSIVAHAVHHWTGIAYHLEPLYQSVVFQAAVAGLWSMIALGVTLWSSRSGSRVLWISGAVLIGCVVVKLFVIDLSGTETIARIVSFLVVGALMLVIGYISPMPPAEERDTV